MRGVAGVLVNCAWSLRVELRLAPVEIYLIETAYLHAMPSTVPKPSPRLGHSSLFGNAIILPGVNPDKPRLHKSLFLWVETI